MISAFGVDHGDDVSKAFGLKPTKVAHNYGVLHSGGKVSSSKYEAGVKDPITSFRTTHTTREASWAQKPINHSETTNGFGKDKTVISSGTRGGLTRRGKAAVGGVAAAGAGASTGLIVAAGGHGKHKNKSGVKKAYTPGTITYHHEQASMHARKKQSGKRQMSGGVAAAGIGAGAAVSADRLGHTTANITKPANVHGSAMHGIRAAKATKTIRHGGLGVAAAGAGLAGIGAGRSIYHARQQNKQAKLAQSARQSRNASIR